jgi:D-alanine-D-alanine ligase
MKTNQSKDKKYGRVGVFFGGKSAERAISLLSGKAVYQALIQEGIDAVAIDTYDFSLNDLIKMNIDRAFIILHGREGEDGILQGFLQILNIPFTGSNPSSSALAMNKAHSKCILAHLGFDTAPFFTVKQNDHYSIDQARLITHPFHYPLFVKPIREGSSVGMSKVQTPGTLFSAIKKAQKYDDVMVESFILGNEYTISLLMHHHLPSIKITPLNDFYDYQAKYESTKTDYCCPSGLNDKDEKKLQMIALKAFEALGCFGWGRVDFIQEKQSKKFMILEVNTVPGMTPHSLLPKSAKVIGLCFKDLVMAILETSFIKKE